MSKCLCATLIVGALALVDVSPLQASHYGPYGKHKYPHHSTLGSLFGHKDLPVYRAAPWYLYWPYDGHFLMPAPLTGPFYPPPAAPYGGANPYFPPPAPTPDK